PHAGRGLREHLAHRRPADHGVPGEDRGEPTLPEAAPGGRRGATGTRAGGGGAGAIAWAVGSGDRLAHRRSRRIWREPRRLSLLGLATATVCGAAALGAIRTEHLSKVFALLVLLAVALSVSGLRVQPTWPALFLGGGAAGVMGTMVGIHGPPI